MRLLFLSFIFFYSLYGRDNPFFPSDPNEKQMATTNKIETLKPFTTQQISLPNSARAIKSIIIKYQNLDSTISTEELEVNNAIDWHRPLILSQTAADEKNYSKAKETVLDGGFIKFIPSGNSLSIKTDDRLIRNFMLTVPYRIVMDFSRDTSFRPKDFIIDKNPYKKIRMGNHDKYYRVVIELDGQYKYKLQANEKDYQIVCY